MQIARILKITDTRKKAEVEGRMVAIAGTGEANVCALCGRAHEIHASVELADGTLALVGIGCAKKTVPAAVEAFEIEAKADAVMEELKEIEVFMLRKCKSPVGPRLSLFVHRLGTAYEAKYYRRIAKWERLTGKTYDYK